MKRSLIWVFVFLLVPLSFAAATSDSPFLPASFNGWQQDSQSVKSGSDSTIVDPADAPVLAEYGFTDGELATYTRGERTMKVKAARFKDSSGAFGAFTFYQQPLMQTEEIGDEGASNNLHILFYRGNILVNVLLDRRMAMSAADLRALANTLPVVQGRLSVEPELQKELPRKTYISHTARYITGPVAMERLAMPVPTALVDFSMSPEVVIGKYQSSWGEANLLLIGYPTPQIAADKMRVMQAASLPGGPFYFRRSGPIVAIVNGNIPADEAQKLLAAVNWDANVTLTQPTRPDLKNNIGNLIVGVFVLIALIALAALIFGFAFGGIRILIKRLFPGKVFDRAEDHGFIRLNLR